MSGERGVMLQAKGRGRLWGQRRTKVSSVPSWEKLKRRNIHDETVIFALCGAWEDDVTVCVLAGGEVECPEEGGGLDEDAVVRNMASHADSAC